MKLPGLILAPLRGVTTRCFRETFAPELREAGFEEATTPFIPAMPGVDPAKDRELEMPQSIPVVPQFIGKSPEALRECLRRAKGLGFAVADLNAGCPFPMVRNKGRGAGLLKTPDVLERMIAVGCETMGEGAFSVKTRLGVERPDELAGLMEIFNRYPLRYLAVHARTARQMYEGECDHARLGEIEALSVVPVVENGDIELPLGPGSRPAMVGRAFLRHLGSREDARELLARYAAALKERMCGESQVVGKLKELLMYWRHLPRWKCLWPVLKLARRTSEMIG